MKSFLSILFLILAVPVQAAEQEPELLPGFRMETLARVPGFVSSVVADSKGTIYCTTTNGWIHRIEGTQSVPVAALPTRAGGNGGLLGMALIDDATAVVHYTTWLENDHVLEDVLSAVDLATGAERVLAAFPGDAEFPEIGVSDEHHGGNPTVAPDGSIFVGIGDYGVYSPAQDPTENGGKIWRVNPDGSRQQFALGMRNPYDLAWDPVLERVVVADNGDEGGDEIHVIDAGANCGWPFGGGVAPLYVWPETVAPTGLQRLNATVPLLARGYLIGGFVTRGLYYFPEVSASRVADPVVVLKDWPEFVLDVTQARTGEIYIATAMGRASSIHRLHVPARGDCNGDGLTNTLDILPTKKEIEDGDRHLWITAHEGSHRGSIGCDVNADTYIDQDDLAALSKLVFKRRRAARS